MHPPGCGCILAVLGFHTFRDIPTEFAIVVAEARTVSRCTPRGAAQDKMIVLLLAGQGGAGLLCNLLCARIQPAPVLSRWDSRK